MGASKLVRATVPDRRRPIGWRVFAALIGTLAIVATGCTGNESAEPAGDGGDATATPAGDGDDDGGDGGGDGELIPVRALNAGGSLSFANALFAESEGYFEEEGLDIEIDPPPNDSSATANLVSQGNVDIATLASSAAYSPIAQNRPIRLYASTMKGPSNSIALSNEALESLEAEGVTQDSPVEDKIAGLAGLTIASEGAGTSQYSMLLTLLQMGGISADEDMTIRPVQEHSAAVTATREGQVDGYIAPSPDLLVGPSEGFAEIWIRFRDIPELAEMPWIELVANTDFVSENPEALKGYLRALWRTVGDFRDRPDHVSDVLKENWFTDMDQELFDDSFALVRDHFSETLIPSEGGLEIQLELYNASAEDPIELSFDEAYDTTFVEETQPE